MKLRDNKWISANSKGVSPLLGSVLIIGLAIMLAALVYQFTFEESQQTIKDVEEAINSADPVYFSINDVKVIDYKHIKFLVENEGNKEIVGFTTRIYGERGVKSYLLGGVKPFETVSLITEYSYAEIGEVTKVDLIPNTEINDKLYVHPISTETTIKINEELSQECKLDINSNSVPDCVDDFDNDGCTRDIDFDDNIACNINSCSLSTGCDNTCRPITCLENEVCSNGQCVVSQQVSSNCVITNAYWSKTDAVENEIVEIVVTANNCEGNVRLTFEEEDTFSPDDFVNNSELDLPTNATLINGTAKVKWKVKWFMDEDGNGPNPELRFNASINPSMISNSSLIIRPAGFLELTDPNVNLVTPVDNGVLIPGNVNFRCDISDLVDVINVSLYTNISGIFRKENFVNPHEHVANNDTIGLYHLNNDSFYQESVTKFVDFSRYSNNGSCSGIPTGCPSKANGLFSSAVDYAQAGPPGDRIQVLDKPELGNMGNLSLSVWVYPRSGGDGGVASIINKPNAFVLRIDAAGSGRSNFRVYNTALQSVNVYSVPGSVPYNVWTHIVGVYNSTHVKIYINGVADLTSAQITGRIRDSVDNLYIGNSDLGSATFDGLIEEVILFNKTLTDSEILNLYQRKDPILTYSLNKTINNVNSGIYKWNCLAYGSGGNAWGLNNYTFIVDGTAPSIIWEDPTPANNSIIVGDSVNLNATVIDESNTSAFFDWNNTLAGYWSFDYLNESGIYDNSSYNNFGIFTGVISSSNISEGIYGKSLGIDKSGYVFIGNRTSLSNITKELTIMGWINSKELTPYQYLVSNDRDVCCGYRGYSLRIYNGKLAFRLAAANGLHQLESNNNIPLNSWHHVAGTFNGTNMLIYIDGNVENSEFFSKTELLTPASFDLVLGSLGFSPSGGLYYLNGSLDEIVIYSRALSLEEINAAFNNKVNRLNTNINDLIDGQYNYSAFAIDATGNLNTSTRFVSIIRIPIVNLTKPSNNAVVSQPSVPLEMQCIATSPNYLDNITLYTNISGNWNITKSIVINELESNENTKFLLHFNNNNLSEENEAPLLESGTNYVTGKHKQAIYVNPEDNLYYNATNNFNISYGTIEFWIKPNWFGNDQRQYTFFFSRNEINGDHIKIGKTFTSRPYVYATFNNSAYEANSYAYGFGSDGIGYWTPGQWHHIAVTYNLTNHSIYLYLDGNERGYANDTSCGPPGCTWNFIPTQTGSNFSVGHNYYYPAQYANASFDELVIYDRILNITEIRDDMNRTDPTRSYNATFKVANILSGVYKWNCLAYDLYNRSGWALENWTFTYNPIPYVTLLNPINSSTLIAGFINFSCIAEDYDKLDNVTLEIYNNNSINILNKTKAIGEIDNSDNNLRLLMHFNNDNFLGENSTFVADASGNGNNGLVTDASFINNGRINGAYLFDSLIDYIEVNGSNSLNITSNKVSIEAWFNATQLKAGILVGENIGQCSSTLFTYNLETGLTGAMGFQIATDTGRTSLFTTGTYTPNQWTHLAGVYNGTHMKLYVNGQLNNIVTKTGDIDKFGSRFFIGKNQACGDYDFRGIIDEVAVYNRDLSDNEVFEHFNLTKKKYLANFAMDLEGGLYKWNCLAYDSNRNLNYASSNNTLNVIARPNLTNIFMGNDGNMYDCKNGCYITPTRHSNVTNLSIRVSLIDSSCSLQTHRVFAHLCLISTTSTETCNELTSNYTFELNNLSIENYGSGGNKYLCNFSTLGYVGPQGTPQFYINPNEYEIYVNVSEAETNLSDSLSNNSWIYRQLLDTGFIDSNGLEIDTLQLGDGDIQLGEFNPGTNEYRLQNWGNVILGINWNATNPNSTIGEWNINNPSDGFILDDDLSTNYPDIGLMALNLTNIPRSFVFGNGLMRCISPLCNNFANESLSTRGHIKPPIGLPVGRYNNEIMYIISPWKSLAPSQFSIDNQASVDTSISALDNRTFVASWVDSLDLRISFIIYDTNGTNLTSTIDVDQTIDKNSRVSVSARNSTHFVIAWYDGLEQDVTYSIYNRTGQINYGPVDLETVVGAFNSDISLAQMNDRFHVCYVDVEESDADDRIVNYANLGIGRETNIGSDMSPELSLQNLIGCTTLNNSRIAYTWFDDFDDDASYAGVSPAGTFGILPTDIDLDVGEFGQVAITSFNGTSPNYSRFALSWFDSAIGEIKIAVKDYYNNNVLSPYLVGYSTFTRLVMTSVRNSETKAEGFILAWHDRLTEDIKAITFDENGTIKYGPFVLADDEDPNNLLFDIYGRNSAGDIGICDDSFIFAYTNITGQTLAKAFKSDGSGWNGNC